MYVHMYIHFATHFCCSVYVCTSVTYVHIYVHIHATEMHSKVYVCTCVNVELLDTAVCGGVCSSPVTVTMGAYPSKAVM